MFDGVTMTGDCACGNEGGSGFPPGFPLLQAPSDATATKISVMTSLRIVSLRYACLTVRIPQSIIQNFDHQKRT